MQELIRQERPRLRERGRRVHPEQRDRAPRVGRGQEEEDEVEPAERERQPELRSEEIPAARHPRLPNRFSTSAWAKDRRMGRPWGQVHGSRQAARSARRRAASAGARRWLIVMAPRHARDAASVSRRRRGRGRGPVRQREEPVEEVAQGRDDRGGAHVRGRGGHEEGPARQLRDREARRREEVVGAGEERGFLGLALERQRRQERLRGRCRRLEPREEPLVADALVRDVLVDENQPLLALGDEERIAVLAEETQGTERRRRDGRGERRRILF